MTPPNDAPFGNEPTTAPFAAPAPPVSGSGVLQSQPDPPRSKKPLMAVIAVIVLAAAGVGVFLATRSDDKPTKTSASTLVRYNHDKSRVEVIDENGDVADSFKTPDTSESDFVAGPAGRVVFDGTSNGEIQVLRISDGNVDRYEVPEELILNRAFIPDSTTLELFSPSGGDVVVIDLESGDMTSARDEVGDDDSIYFPARHFESGSTYNDAGGSRIQTLVVPSVGSDLWAVPGTVVALDGARSLAIDSDEDAATVGIYTRDEQVGSVEVDGSVRGGLLTGDTTALVVTTDGDILKVDVSDDAQTDADTVAGPLRGGVSLSGDRMLVVGDGTASYLVDAAGKTLAELEPVDDDDGNPQSVELGPAGFHPGASCFVAQPGTAPRPDGGEVTIRDLDTGDVLAELDSSGSVADNDGCVVVTPFDTTADAYFGGEVHEFDGYSNVLAVAPDLKHVVVSGKDGFALVDVESSEATDLDRYQYAYITD